MHSHQSMLQLCGVEIFSCFKNYHCRATSSKIFIYSKNGFQIHDNLRSIVEGRFWHWEWLDLPPLYNEHTNIMLLTYSVISPKEDQQEEPAWARTASSKTESSDSCYAHLHSRPSILNAYVPFHTHLLFHLAVMSGTASPTLAPVRQTGAGYGTAI